MFRLVKILNGRINESEPMKLPTSAGVEYAFGSMLTLSSGKLTNCTATAKPQFLCGEDAKADEKSEITVYPIDANQIFETKVSASPASLFAGSKVTLSINGTSADGVTATTTNGVVEIFDLAGATQAGDKVCVRIV